jgi:DNA end-binding protein Ku
VLLRRALEDTDRVAVVQFALREKTRLGALRIKDDVLVLQSLLWPDEVREANFPSLDADIRISAQERDMSAALVESMAADFEPSSFTDEYQVQLRQLIDAKLEQGESLDTEETFGVEAGEGGKGEVIDLMEALKRSLDRKRGGGEAASAGGESDDEADAGDEETETAKPAGKRSGTKAAASRTAAAKTGTDDAKPAARSSAKSTSASAKTTGARSTASKSTTAKSTTATSTAAKSTAAKTTASKSSGTGPADTKTSGTKAAAKPAAKTTRARKPA